MNWDALSRFLARIDIGPGKPAKGVMHVPEASRLTNWLLEVIDTSAPENAKYSAYAFSLPLNTYQQIVNSDPLRTALEIFWDPPGQSGLIAFTESDKRVTPLIPGVTDWLVSQSFGTTGAVPLVQVAPTNAITIINNAFAVIGGVVLVGHDA